MGAVRKALPGQCRTSNACTQCPAPSTYSAAGGLTSARECVCAAGYERSQGAGGAEGRGKGAGVFIKTPTAHPRPWFRLLRSACAGSAIYRPFPRDARKRLPSGAGGRRDRVIFKFFVCTTGTRTPTDS